jgi:hypothetical protein
LKEALRAAVDTEINVFRPLCARLPIAQVLIEAAPAGS